MQKAICINAGPLPGDTPGQPPLLEGEIYTVLREAEGVDLQGNTYDCYKLLEVSRCYVYQKERFILTSEVDETQYALEEQKVLNP